jgi:hypothetical protein
MNTTPKPVGSASQEQLEESNLHWVLCGGMHVGHHVQPKVWRLRPKDECDREKQRAKDLQKMASMARLISEVMRWHSDPESCDYNECDKSKCQWCETASRLLTKS